MISSKEQYLKYSLSAIVLVLGGILFYYSLPFLSGLLGACTIYLLVRKQMKYLTQKKRLKRSLAAALILIESLLLFLIPISLAIWLLIGKITGIDVNTVVDAVHNLVSMINQKTGYDLLSAENLSTIALSATEILQVLINQVSSFVITSLVLLFILYFMLLGGDEMERYLYDILPFRTKDKQQIIQEVNKMVRANAIGIPLLAIVQGIVAMIGYLIFGAPDPILFAFLTCFATIIPLIGTSLIWFPLSAYLVLTGDWVSGVGLAIYAIVVISNVDNLARFALQEKLAATHPLVTVFGVIIGLSIFGFWGVIFGPLLFSLFLLCFDIYKREYLDKLKDPR